MKNKEDVVGRIERLINAVEPEAESIRVCRKGLREIDKRLREVRRWIKDPSSDNLPKLQAFFGK
jgi:hypothetical protein